MKEQQANEPVQQNTEETATTVEINNPIEENAENKEVIEEQITSEADSIQNTIDELKKEINHFKDQNLRLVAEFDNYRKRTAREMEELRQTATKSLIQSLIGILDDSERAEKTIQTANDIEALKTGINLILSKLRSTLESKGLKAMNTQIGDDFDLELQEAITEIPAATPELSGKIVDVIEKGYYLNEVLIRHAKVVVGK